MPTAGLRPDFPFTSRLHQSLIYTPVPYNPVGCVSHKTEYKPTKKQLKCNFAECGKYYSSEDTRRRHYRNHHALQWSAVRRCKENTLVKKEQVRKKLQLDRAMSVPNISNPCVRLLPHKGPQFYRQQSMPYLTTIYPATSIPLNSPGSINSLPGATTFHPSISAQHSQSSNTFMSNEPSAAMMALETQRETMARNTVQANQVLGNLPPFSSVPGMSPEPDRLLLELQRLVDSYGQ
ncbi:hypothetical protein SARC_08871 [Sphaeroforma arctica JP610]|uniref:C2H2-type domain-containing protein n=1 Tax=Sphaeroforma arctica JP610 TaxID=667725 RepID=A0A0L0FPR2_9EUKA|nr:hypothetical protein SARC_08871 [Sphaeroforma arctica JP610]KNC78699.1 hypothetical protein SARC_08871 [Sphaeroforma arctica JP610]|eukprot:XP_014152601.1 hypothetical protein SARC_08871 [Sphaeroforma arctica JP610]